MPSSAKHRCCVSSSNHHERPEDLARQRAEDDLRRMGRTLRDGEGISVPKTSFLFNRLAQIAKGRTKGKE